MSTEKEKPEPEPLGTPPEPGAMTPASSQERRFQDLVELTQDWLWETDVDGNFSFSGPQASTLLGFSEREIIGRNPRDLMPDGRLERVPPDACFGGKRPIAFRNEPLQFLTRSGDIVGLDASGVPTFDVLDTWTGFRGVFRAQPRYAPQTERSETQLAEALVRASHDSLTGLWNRRAFQERLEAEIDKARNHGHRFSVVLADVDNFKFFNEAYGHLAGDDVLRMIGNTVRSRCRSGDAVARLGGDEFAVLLPGLNRRETEGRMSAVCETVVGHGYKPSGHAVPIPVGISCGVAVWPEDSHSHNDSAGPGISDTAVSLLLRADERLYQNKTNSRDMWSATLRDDWKDDIEGFDVLDSLIVAIHMRDRYTLRHSEDVMLYSILIAQELDLDIAQIEKLKLAAYLHDIGMIGVPEALMRRPARLTTAEFESVKLHPAMGAAIVSTVRELNGILPAIRNHHERWDGGGYPAGKSRVDIPLMARIVAVADAFSAMTTDRPFRSGRPVKEAGELLRAGSNLQWDPDCVEAFLSAYFRGNSPSR